MKYYILSEQQLFDLAKKSFSWKSTLSGSSLLIDRYLLIEGIIPTKGITAVEQNDMSTCNNRYNLLRKIARKHKVNELKVKDTSYVTRDIVIARQEFIYCMRFILGIKIPDIAKYLNISVSTIYDSLNSHKKRII